MCADHSCGTSLHVALSFMLAEDCISRLVCRGIPAMELHLKLMITMFKKNPKTNQNNKPRAFLFFIKVISYLQGSFRKVPGATMLGSTIFAKPQQYARLPKDTPRTGWASLPAWVGDIWSFQPLCKVTARSKSVVLARGSLQKALQGFLQKHWAESPFWESTRLKVPSGKAPS